jgi:hypothetical protein
MTERPMSFYQVVTAAVKDIAEYGYDSQERIDFWLGEIKAAAERDLVSEDVLRQAMTAHLRVLYDRMIERGGVMKRNPGVSRFTIEWLKPKLRNELDRRILTSANLIKLNREQAVAKTLQRFSGWATSIPAGGSRVVEKNETKENIQKSLKSLPFEERRVIIDQGHKLSAAINDIIAKDNGAIAAEWHSNWRQSNYNYREDHRERDQKVYAIRDNWALKSGLMKKGPNGYTDEITEPGEEVYCRCYYRYIYGLRDLPDEMITKAGKDQLAKVRAAINVQ